MILRLATPADHDALERVMKASVGELGAACYDARQNRGFVEHVAKVDAQLVRDGTCFVIEIDGDLAACGGWSQRDKLFTGNDGAAGGTRLLVPPEPARVRAMFVAPGYSGHRFGQEPPQRWSRG